MKSSVRRVDSLRLFVGTLTLCISTFALAGTTGKIAGTARDTQGRPIPGVAVALQGTRLGATTDADGRYIILLVPPGIHTASAHLVGYRTTTMTDVDVAADLTTQVNFTLSEEAIEMEAVVVKAERPPIEADVTSSQIIVDAARVAEAPVARMLDYLAYEPGVSISQGNELQIRGGGPSEIRFQVDGLDRTDALTSKPYAQLNQVLVSEVTLLTGGFNAEYGNVRSGMVNVVNKDGTERRSMGLTLPWTSGVYSIGPAQRKHFGPGAYDETQYDYWLMSSKSPFADSGLVGALYWPFLYDSTKNDPQFNDPNHPLYRNPRQTQFRVFRGWSDRITSINVQNRRGTYGKNDWKPAEAREAWEWEANMNEQVWRYANEPDWNLDLASGWALPRKLGGMVVGYSYTKEMTIVPALRPYFTDQTVESKLTVTPTDQLKVTFSYMLGETHSTGAGSKGMASNNPELAESGATVAGSDPVSLRSSGQLISTVSSITEGNNKLHMSYNGPLDGDFTQWGVTLNYTFSPRTFFTASVARSESKWDLKRDLPRVDVTDFDSRYTPSTSFGFRDWLSAAYAWSDTNRDGRGDPPSSIEDAIGLDRAIFRHPFSVPNVYPTVPSEGKYVKKEFDFDSTMSAVVVSPQGYVQGAYPDLSGTYSLGTGGEVTLDGRASQIVARGDLTHVVGQHTLRSGFEYIGGDLEYHTVQSSAIIGSPQYTEFRDYGGDWLPTRPSVLGVYVQDKVETQGMIANGGLRIERFDGGQRALLYDSLFQVDVFGRAHGAALWQQVCIAAGWDTAAWGGVPANYDAVYKKLGDNTPLPWDVVNAIPYAPAMPYWRIAPRFGISHPVSDHTKFFFNYGVFYSKQKAAVMYGIGDHDGRLGFAGSLRDSFNPNLRPAKTTMYEVGVEHVLPFRIVLTVRGYAKYNVDQVSTVNVDGYLLQGGYRIYRNSDYEDIHGAEIKIARMSGRFVNGWFTYERSSSRSGEVGLKTVDDRPTNIAPYDAFARVHTPQAFFRGLLRFTTPNDWGPLAGGWALSVIEAYQSGGEVIYNPEGLEVRELPKENFLRTVDYWNTDLKLTKGFHLPGGRSLSFYLDVTNVLNTKRLNGGGLYNYQEYLKYLVDRRASGADLKVGQDVYVFTQPYRSASGYWQPPLSPRTEWLQSINPRYYRLGVRFDL